MKRMIKFFTFAAIVAAFAVPALAQSKDCTDENKAAWYDTFLKNRQGEAPQQKAAYEAAKNYLGSCPDDPADAIRTYLAKWVKAYEGAKAIAENKNKLQDAYTKKNYSEAVSAGKQVVQTEPDFVTGYMLIALSGYNATLTGNTSLLPDAEQAAGKALEMVEAGKPFAPFASKDSAIAWLNYIIGKAKVKNAPADAIPFILKGARDSDLKKAPGLYLDLAQAYGEGPLAKLAEEYEQKYKGKDETPESKLALANIYQMMDRQIDALARAVALASGNDKNSYMAALTQLYKDRNKSEAGLNELVANILSKPLPEMPAPLTSLPTTSTPTGSPTNVGSPGTNGGAGNSGGTKTAGSNNTATTGQTKTTSTSTTGGQTGSAKPSPSPTPRPKQRRSNHRVGM